MMLTVALIEARKALLNLYWCAPGLGHAQELLTAAVVESRGVDNLHEEK